MAFIQRFISTGGRLGSQSNHFNVRKIIDFLPEKKNKNQEIFGSRPVKKPGSVACSEEMLCVPYQEISMEKIAKLVGHIKSLPEVATIESTSKQIFRFSDSSNVDPCELLATKLSRNVDWVN